MTTIEKIEKYIAKENLSNGRYEMKYQEATALSELLSLSGSLYAIGLAFDYGRAKGLREAKAGVRA